MRLLVLGGTAWLGRYIARTAVELGHEVTCLARGSSGEIPEGARLVRADRTRPGAYDSVAGETWDVAVDLTRQPGQAKSAAAALAERIGFCVLVSSTSAYADHSVPGQDEDGALLPALDGDVMESMETYGEAKVACERHVLQGFGTGRTAIMRVGLIGGPGDIFGRTGYWPLRFARPARGDGAVLVPDAPELPTQVIDVRDLAAWIVEAGTRQTAGIFNVTGETLPFPAHIEAARAVAGHTGPVVSADREWLLAQGVQEWMGERSLPLWLADPDWVGFNARDNSRARAAGLIVRSLQETLKDTLAWELTRDPARTRQAGLSDEDELALLDALAQARMPSRSLASGHRADPSRTRR
jgi:2'-hydroxyisoflavone reductase